MSPAEHLMKALSKKDKKESKFFLGLRDAVSGHSRELNTEELKVVEAAWDVLSQAVLWGSSDAVQRRPRAPKADAPRRGRGRGGSNRAQPKAASFGIVDWRLGLRHSEATAPESLERFSLDGSRGIS